MTSTSRASRHRSRQYRVLLPLSVAAMLPIAILQVSGSTSFQRYLGASNPVPKAAALVFMGAAALLAIDHRHGFSIERRARRLQGLACAAGLASLCTIAPITIDLVVGFPRDMNVAWPQALLFYPAIGYVAEMVFHVLPLAALLLLFGPVVGSGSQGKLHWAAIVAVALIEPIFQTVLGRSDGLPVTATAAVAAHVYILNLLQLWIFKRFDFVSMLAFRLVFYAYWHLFWGYVRLQVLF